MKRIMIAGTHSGCGKTTVTCALLAALRARGLTPTALKCGPDYIDPMFHRGASGVSAYNADPFFLDGDGLRAHVAAHGGALAIMEGAMGYYDGIATTEEASAYTVAKETETPVVLVVSAKGAGHSLTALLEGFQKHRSDSHIRGVIFNDANEKRYADLQKIAQDAGVKAYGFLPRKAEWSMPSRHLGLLPADEVDNLKGILAELGEQAEQSLDIDGLLALVGTVAHLSAAPLQAQPSAQPSAARGIRVAIARDEAFCFLYQENLEALEALGCALVFFSPLRDAALPESIHGLYLCGGYPELYTKELSANASMRESLRQALSSGLPTIAECGGFLYLHETLDGLPMCGVIPGSAFETKQLRRFGYITVIAEKDNLLCRAGESIRSHEFHYWDSDCVGADFIAQKAGRKLSYPCIHATDTLYAGFPHLYFPANPAFAERFVERMTHHAP